MTVDITELAIGVLAGLQAVLFGAFGIMASIYTTYAAAANAAALGKEHLADSENMQEHEDMAGLLRLPDAAIEARNLCKLLCKCILVDTLFICLALLYVWPQTFLGILLVVAMIFTLVVLAAASWRLTRKM